MIAAFVNYTRCWQVVVVVVVVAAVAAAATVVIGVVRGHCTVGWREATATGATERESRYRHCGNCGSRKITSRLARDSPEVVMIITYLLRVLMVPFCGSNFSPAGSV